MARDKAFREAERKIAAALSEGATELDLENMGLTELPKSVGKLVRLKVLKLGYSFGKDGEKNKITTLPKELRNLTQLQWLYLHDNQLTTLPKELGNLTRLQELSLEGNQLQPELAAVYKQGLSALKAYLQEQSQEQILLNEAKMVLVGEGGRFVSSEIAA
ncbi:MAG: leucine-rich repeat domain-containing protein [Prochloron sp. SP5CPC1]|nr:leucine-rich repeat domain-containing protein [Candidatus Paraprochloron terpiosi SP5CPC1]